MTSEVDKLKAESLQLENERQQVEGRIRNLNQQRNNRSFQRFERRPNQEYNPGYENRKRTFEEVNMSPRNISSEPKVKSKVVMVSSEDTDVSTPRPQFSDRWNPEETSNEIHDKPTLADVYAKPDVVQRNKRMFGALMGHLGKAKEILQHDSLLIEKQDQQKLAASVKNKEESKRLFQLQREVSREEREKVGCASIVLSMS